MSEGDDSEMEGSSKKAALGRGARGRAKVCILTLLVFSFLTLHVTGKGTTKSEEGEEIRRVNTCKES